MCFTNESWMNKMKHLRSFENREGWRHWLEKNHNRKTEIWLLFYKKTSGKIGLQYEEALEEAICFGWIDGKLKRIDDKKHILRFSPRKKNSIWSKNNRKRALRMIKARAMTSAGLEKIEEAKRNGRWASAYSSRRTFTMPHDLKRALMRDPKAWMNFKHFASSYKLMYIHWVSSAKRDETRRQRIGAVVKRARLNVKPGIP